MILLRSVCKNKKTYARGSNPERLNRDRVTQGRRKSLKKVILAIPIDAKKKEERRKRSR